MNAFQTILKKLYSGDNPVFAVLKAENKLELAAIDDLDSALSENLYHALIQQLNKDLLLTNLHFVVPENCKPAILLEELNRFVSELVNNDFNTFLNLLYRIDLSENILIKLPKDNQEEYISSISFLILKREWEKVWFRKKYS